MSILSDTAIVIAIGEIDKQEIPRGSNWGVHVQKYLNSVGINFPASWCLAFVYWCFDEARKKIDVPNVLIKTGGVLHEWEAIGSKYKSTIPQVGSIFIMDFGGGLGHTGIIEKIDLDNELLHTIEGNTNDTGAREGYEVCRKIRQIKKCKGFISV